MISVDTNGDGTSGKEDVASLRVANEFADVRVRTVATHNGTRLEIYSPRLDRRIRLCPLELESLTWQSPETFSMLLSLPFGPESATQ